MKVKIIKGTNQIGGCITEITSNKGTKIIIDFGNDLDCEEKFDVAGLTDDKPTYSGVFITHSHGDHIGLVNTINKNIPIYMEEKTFIIYNVLSDFTFKEKIQNKIEYIKMDIPIIIDDIKVTPYRADHSSPYSCMYLVECDGKRVLHTGDFRNHGWNEYVLNNTMQKIKKIDALIIEGTSLSRGKNVYQTERELSKEAYNIFKKYDQVFIIQSSTNLDRTRAFCKACMKVNKYKKKNFILDPLSGYLINELLPSINIDYKNIFIYDPYTYLISDNFTNDFKIKYLGHNVNYKMFENYVMEIKQSYLPNIRKFYQKGYLTNTCLIYSMWSGYPKKCEELNKFIEELKNMGIDYYELHTSGHADVKTLKYVEKTLNPNKTIVIHTKEHNKKDIFEKYIELNDNEEIEV